MQESKQDLKENETEEALDQEEETEDQEETLSEEEEKIKALEKENKEQYERMLRIQAEYDNFKRRTQEERIRERKYQAEDLANQLLPVLDNFERALQIEVTEEIKGLYEGIEMVYKQFLEALKSEGIEQIEALGEQFDPNLHHGVMQVEEEDFDSNEILEELQKGYMLKDKVLRAAMVKVNK